MRHVARTIAQILGWPMLAAGFLLALGTLTAGALAALPFACMTAVGIALVVCGRGYPLSTIWRRG